MSQTFFLENKRYDIPNELTTDFLNKNPNAVKGLNYVSDDKTYLIPETLRLTNLGEKVVGDKINLEIETQTRNMVDTISEMNKESIHG